VKKGIGVEKKHRDTGKHRRKSCIAETMER
jgi:hypothetical protein